MSFKSHELREVLSKTVRLLTMDGIEVTYRGVTPYVSADKTGKVTRLNLPEITDNASPELLEAIQGYVDHEVGHVLYTPFETTLKQEANLHSLLNIVEDIRIERLLPRDLPGTRDNLERMYDKWLPMMIEPHVNTAVASGDQSQMLPAVLVPALRALSGQKVFKNWMDQNAYWNIIDPLISRVDRLEERLKAMETYDEVIDLAKAIAAAITPPPPPPGSPQFADSDSKPSSGDDKQEQEPEPKQNDKDEEKDAKGQPSADDQDDAEADRKDDQSGGADGDAGDDEPEDDSDASSGDEDSDASQDEPAQGATDDNADDGDEDEGQSDAAESGDDEDSDDGSGDGSADGEADDAQAAEDADDEDASDKAADTGGTYSGLPFDFDALKDTDDMLANYIGQQVSSNAREYRVFSRDYDKIVDIPNVDSASIEQIEIAVQKATGPLQKELRRMIAARTQATRYPGQRRGRLHAPSLHRIMAGDDRVFTRREEGIALDTAISLVIDCSGSMSGPRIKLAMQTAYGLAAVLHRINVPFEVVGYTTGELPDQKFYEEAIEANAITPITRVIPIVMPKFKLFDEPFTPSIQKRFAKMHDIPSSTTFPMHSTIEGDAVELLAMRLLRRPEKRKLMMVMSDGKPAGHTMNECRQDNPYLDHAAKTVREVREAGVDMLGIGIQDKTITGYYPDHIVIQNVDEMPALLLKALKKFLLTGNRA